MNDVSIDSHQNICTIRMGEGLNALSALRTRALAQALYNADHDPDIRVILLCGNAKAFSVGADLNELSCMIDKEESEDDEDPLYSWLEPWRFVARARKPVIVALDGYVLGGGFEIALMGDIVLATPETQCAQPEIHLGFIPGCGGTVRLFHQLGYHRAFYICATGETLPIETLKEWGLIHNIVPREELMASAQNIAHNLAQKPLDTLISLKSLMKGYRFGEPSVFQNALAREYQTFSDCARSGNGREGMQAFLEKRTPQFT